MRLRDVAPLRDARWQIAGLVVLLTAACGKEGPPQPPLRPEPGHIREVSATRTDNLVRITLAIPAANFDGTTPPVVNRVEVYAATLPGGATPPGATELFNQKFLYKMIPVRGADDPPATSGPPTAVAGETFVFDDVLDAQSINAAEKPVRYYLIAGATGRSRRGRPSPILPVPLTTSPLPPAKVDATYTEQTVTLSWPGVEGQTYRVAELGARAAIDQGKELTAEPLTTPSFELPAWFGTERCFTVQAIATTGRVSIVGTPGGPFCQTPVDTFPPAAPTGLLAVQEERGIVLRWTAVEASDLAGYLVLRGDGASETLQLLFKAPIADTTYVDQAIKAGVTYTYAIIAMDKAGNISAQSGRQQVTAREAVPRREPADRRRPGVE